MGTKKPWIPETKKQGTRKKTHNQASEAAGEIQMQRDGICEHAWTREVTGRLKSHSR